MKRWQMPRRVVPRIVALLALAIASVTLALLLTHDDPDAGNSTDAASIRNDPDLDGWEKGRRLMPFIKKGMTPEEVRAILGPVPDSTIDGGTRDDFYITYGLHVTFTLDWEDRENAAVIRVERIELQIVDGGPFERFAKATRRLFAIFMDWIS